MGKREASCPEETLRREDLYINKDTEKYMCSRSCGVQLPACFCLFFIYPLMSASIMRNSLSRASMLDML